MRIKKRLQINVAVSVIIAVVISLVLLQSLYQLNRANNTGKIVGELMISALERDMLRNDYFRHNNPKAKAQMFAKHEQVGKLLESASRNFRDREDRKGIADLIEIHESIGKSFAAIVANRENKGLDPDATTTASEVEERLLNQLNMRVNDMVSNVRALRESSIKARVFALRLAGGGVIFALLVLITVAILNSQMMDRAITDRVGRLRHGALLIGGGDLEHRIDVEGDDELAELSESFNAMTAKLSDSYRNLTIEIGERQRAEEALQKLNEELEIRVAERTGALRASVEDLHREIDSHKQTAERLQATLANLERSNKELEQFAYVASHDLQEPLRMVSSYTQLLAQRYEGQLDDKAKKFIGYAVDGAVRMQRLINDLLAYSRVSTQGETLEMVDSHAVLGEALRNLAAAIKENLALVINDDLPTVRADATQLSQLFQNLIGNAIKFRSADLPRIHVSACDLGRDWRFSVEDNGIGIDTQYAEKVFVIFQRLHTRLEYPGTGIGLAVCKRIVERHGGRIWFESEPGKGSTFYFTLPK
jgi:signal transduction histidine kinase